MDKITRVKRAVEGKEVDRIPFSFWTHLPEVDGDPKAVAEKTVEMYKTYDLDFIKLMNNGMYTAEAFGGVVDNSGVAEGKASTLSESPVQQAEDFDKITLDNFNQSIYNRELDHLNYVLELTDNKVPVIITIFSPLTTLDKLSGGRVNEFIEAGKGELLVPALKVVTATTVSLVQKAIELGASGIYFATQLASFDRTSQESYETYGVPYDLEILESVKEDGWLNTLHVHGDNVMFDLMKDYPVPVFNWHNWDTEPAIEVGQNQTGKTIMGGLSPETINASNIDELTHQVSEDIKRLNGRNIMITSNCTVSPQYEEQTIRAIQKVAHDTFEEIK